MEWISVKTRKPDEELEQYQSKFSTFSAIPIIANCPCWTHTWIAYYDGEDFWEEKCMYRINEIITHWMPIPEPPKGE